MKGGAVSDVVSLPTLLRNHTLVDLLDLDVQGAEWVVFNVSMSDGAQAALDALDAKVLRLHVGTHAVSARDTPLTTSEAGLVTTLHERGWRSLWTMGVTNGQCAESKHFRLSPWGPVCMADGALSFVNARLASRLGARA